MRSGLKSSESEEMGDEGSISDEFRFISYWTVMATLTTTHCNRHSKIKLYPGLVHVIKSFSSRLQVSVPKTLQGIQNQAAGALCMIHNLASKEDQAIGGFRIDVTVKAKSLQDAHRLADDTGFINPSYWLKGGDVNVAYRGLTAQLVTREGLLANDN